LGLIGQSEQTNATNSNRDPILEPIQEASADDTLAESSEQARPDKTTDDIMDAVLIEQLMLNQPRYDLCRLNFHCPHFLIPCF
jgi:hypothetical protein